MKASSWNTWIVTERLKVLNKQDFTCLIGDDSSLLTGLFLISNYLALESLFAHQLCQLKQVFITNKLYILNHLRLELTARCHYSYTSMSFSLCFPINFRCFFLSLFSIDFDNLTSLVESLWFDQNFSFYIRLVYQYDNDTSENISVYSSIVLLRQLEGSQFPVRYLLFLAKRLTQKLLRYQLQI